MVLLYLATDSEVGRFRAFLQRRVELLRSLPAWTLRIVVPPWPIGLVEAHAKVADEEFRTQFRPVFMDDLRRYCNERRRLETGCEPPDQEQFDYAEQAFKTSRFQLLYRRWLTEGDGVLELVSKGLKEALGSGAGRVETLILPHQYRYLAPLVNSTTRKAQDALAGHRSHVAFLDDSS